MLDRRGIELAGDAYQHRIALVAIVREHTYLDQRMRFQRDVDLMQHRRGQPVLSHAHHRMEMVGLRAKLAALLRCDVGHGASVARQAQAGAVAMPRTAAGRSIPTL